MIDLKKIKNKKLKQLISDSNKFAQLSEKEQQKQFANIVKLTKDQQEEMCEFFIEEAEREEKELVALKALYSKLLDLKSSVEKLVKAQEEDVQTKKEMGTMENLLSQINNS